MAKTRAKTKAEKEPAEPPKAPPERTSEEQALVDSYKNRERIDRPPRKKLTKRPDGTFNASFEGDVDLEVSKLARAFGVADWIVGSTLAHQVANANQIMRPGEPELVTNVAISLVQGIGPRDALEAMLAAQMVATHTTAMEMLRRLNLEQKSTEISDSIASRATKLMRTFTAQVEALNRHRNAGKQVITVNHIGQQVNASEAIAFGCTPGEAGGIIKNGEQPHVSEGNQQLNYRPEEDMRSQREAQRKTVPASTNGKWAVLSPRGRQPRQQTRPRELELQARPLHDDGDN